MHKKSRQNVVMLVLASVVMICAISSAAPPPPGEPTISGTPISGITAETYYSFTPTASDSAGYPLTFSVANKPTWATFSAVTGMLSGTPPTSGTFSNIVISANDGTMTATLPGFSIAVAASGGTGGTGGSGGGGSTGGSGGGGGGSGGGSGTPVPVMDGLWLLPGVLAGFGLISRRRKS